jgi:hypothetical protein
VIFFFSLTLPIFTINYENVFLFSNICIGNGETFIFHFYLISHFHRMNKFLKDGMQNVEDVTSISSFI